MSNGVRMIVRRVLLVAALTAGAAATTLLASAGPASASCGTIGDYQVCNPVVQKVEDLLKPTS
jgi:hypothetical protein